MCESRQQKPSQNVTLRDLEEVLSGERIGRYLRASGHDNNLALRLYLWNTKLGEAFFSPLQAVEVALRNRVSTVFANVYGAEWWRNVLFLEHVGEKGRQNIEEVRRRLRQNRKPIETGRIVADLSFGFWMNALNGRFNPTVWSSHLGEAFPNLPRGMTRDAVQRHVRKVSDLRNRVFHHEPIFDEDVSLHYSRCVELLKWLSPEKTAWVKPNFRVPAVLREKPRRSG